MILFQKKHDEALLSEVLFTCHHKVAADVVKVRVAHAVFFYSDDIDEAYSFYIIFKVDYN